MSYIGIDLGTSSVKVIQVDAQNKLIGSVSASYQCSFLKPGYSEQNPLDWYDKTIECLNELTNKTRQDVIGISFSGQMHGLVLLDNNDNILRPAILWNDQRSTKQCAYLNNEIGNRQLGEWTSNMALPGFTAPKLLWVKENEPEIFSKIAKVMLPKDYLCYRLCTKFVTDVSDASGTLYFDVNMRKYSQEMLDILDIRESQLPSVYESYGVVGKMIPINQYFKDTKVIIGGGDQAVGAIGTGTVDSGMCTISLGTSGVAFVPTDTCLVNQDYSIHSFAHANGKNHLMGVMLSAAGSLKWWYEDILKKDNYDCINAEISNIRTESLYFLPYLAGERTPINDSDAKGVFIGMDVTTTQNAMTLSVMEGVGFALKDSLRLLKDMNIDIQRLRICGGGAKNHIWVQILSNIFNMPIEILEIEEAPAYGAAILAMVGCNLYDNVEQAANALVSCRMTLQPESEMVAYYDKKYATFIKIYPTIKELYPALNE